MKGLHLGRCLIYMPEIDLWAVNSVNEQETEDHGRNMGTSKLACSPASRKHDKVFRSFEYLGWSDGFIVCICIHRCSGKFHLHSSCHICLHFYFAWDFLDICMHIRTVTHNMSQSNVHGEFMAKNLHLIKFINTMSTSQRISSHAMLSACFHFFLYDNLN